MEQENQSFKKEHQCRHPDFHCVHGEEVETIVQCLNGMGKGHTAKQCSKIKKRLYTNKTAQCCSGANQ